MAAVVCLVGLVVDVQPVAHRHNDCAIRRRACPDGFCNADPDPVTGNPRTNSANNYFLPFSSFSPFGFNGRFVYGRVSYRF